MKNIFKYLLIVFIMFFNFGCGGGGGSSSINTNPNNLQCTNEFSDVCALASLGNSSDDALVRGIYNEVSNFFEFNTEFHFFNEGSQDKMNAFATESNYLFFGKYMFEQLKKSSPANYPTMVSGIMAHEYGHIVQFNTLITAAMLAPTRQQVNVGSTVVLSELEADAFSGLYMYFKLNSDAEIDSYFKLLEEIGDNAFTEPSHHGTSAQREAAAAYGILSADYIIRNNLQDYINWVDIRVEFIRAIAQYILFDVDYRSAKSYKSNYGITDKQIEIIRDIAKGKKHISDLEL